jgi:hypothetical protein
MTSIYCEFEKLGEADAASAFLHDVRAREYGDEGPQELDGVECQSPESLGVEQR